MAENQNKSRRKLDIWNKIAVVILSLFLVGCISVFFVLVNIINDPEGMRFTEDGLSTLSNSRIYDNAGNLVYEFGEEIREDITYDRIPQDVIDAFLAIEDSRFFDHNGFDLPRFIASAINNLRSGEFSQGGSTLTMQMIDNAFTRNQENKILEEKGSISKIEQVELKIQEIYLSLIAEQSISKEQIFEYYVNRIWFGSGGNTRGIQKAAQYYFSKDVSQLNLSEAAFLAGSVNAPDRYNPMNNLYDVENDHLAAATERRNETLMLMLNHGYITQTEYDLAVNTDIAYSINYSNASITTDPNQAYIDQTIEEVSSLTGQDPSVVPMDIYSALNQDVQNQADQICAGNIVPWPDDALDTGFSVIDNASGEIIAVGPGRTYHTDVVKYDNSMTRKQPGSSMKPLLAYVSCFDILGWSTNHQVNDVAKDYFHTGQNLNNAYGGYRGSMSLQTALGVSTNTTAAAAMVDLVNTTGYDYWIDYCRKLGFDDDVCENFVEQYAIGGADMFATPIQQASAYTIFANQGNRVNPHRVRRVIRRADQVETEGNSTVYTLVSPGAAFMMSTLLQGVVTGNYGNFNEILQSGYPVYGKSGTSDWGSDGLQYGIPTGVYKDEWSIGYTSQFTIATWTGYTTQYASLGYYFSDAVLFQATAFYISHYMLDYCQQYGDYHDIARTEDVADYGGGYIKAEFVSQGDTYTSSAGSIPSAEPESEPEPEETPSEETPSEEPSEEPSAQEQCENSGGTWSDVLGGCEYPIGGKVINPYINKKSLFNLFSWL